MKLFENVRKNGFPVERRVPSRGARILQIYKNRKTLAERERERDLENQRCTKGGRGGKSCAKKFKGIAKFNWKKRIQVVPASAKMYYAVLTDVAST